MSLSRSTGEYRIVRESELTEDQLRILKLAGRERVLERLHTLLGEGRLSASQVLKKYGTLMSKVGDA